MPAICDATCAQDPPVDPLFFSKGVTYDASEAGGAPRRCVSPLGCSAFVCKVDVASGPALMSGGHAPPRCTSSYLLARPPLLVQRWCAACGGVETSV